MKKIYFKFLFISFSAIFLTIVTIFYIGYLKREQLKKDRLRLVEIGEIYSIIKENSPLDRTKIPILKEIEKSYSVALYIKTKNGFNFFTDKRVILPKIRSRLIPINRLQKIRRHSFHMRKKITPFVGREVKVTYYVDAKTKILKGIKLVNNEFEIFIFKKTGISFVLAFFSLIGVIFLLFGAIFFLIRKWYVNPLIQLETSIKSIENNLNSPELYTDSSGTLTPVFNALNDLKRRIIHEINSKEEMLRDISHDLKTPLSRIKLALEFIENGKIKKSINEDVKELEELISKILDIYAVKQEDCKCSLKDFLDKMVNKYSNIDFIVDCDKDVIVPVCEEDLKRIFYNLVENSVKFADVSKGIFIKAEIKNNIIEIRYKDCETKGNKPDLDRIFDYFYKSDKARNKNINKGFGLGLSIVKKLCESYGGKISAEFSDCNGIEFLIQFPINN